MFTKFDFFWDLDLKTENLRSKNLNFDLENPKFRQKLTVSEISTIKLKIYHLKKPEF